MIGLDVVLGETRRQLFICSTSAQIPNLKKEYELISSEAAICILDKVERRIAILVCCCLRSTKAHA
jgi:hypothetical protein